MDRRLCEGLLAVLVGLTALVPVGSAWPDETARSRIVVTAQVAAIARIEGLEQPGLVAISRDDAARGSATARAVLKVRSNAAAGYVLTLWPRAAWFQSVRVAAAGAAAELPDDGGSIVLTAPRSAIGEVSLELTFRLREDTGQGEYAWPVEFEVSPL